MDCISGDYDPNETGGGSSVGAVTQGGGVSFTSGGATSNVFPTTGGGRPVRPTPHIHTSTSTTQQWHPLIGSGKGVRVPDEKFLVRTVVLSNMTTLHNGIENFKVDMESKLSAAYQSAYGFQERYKRSAAEAEEFLEAANGTEIGVDFDGGDDDSAKNETTAVEANEPGNANDTIAEDLLQAGNELHSDDAEDIATEDANLFESKEEEEDEDYNTDFDRKGNETNSSADRQTRQLVEPGGRRPPTPPALSTDVESGPPPVVRIHNIRSSLPEPEIEMIYTVYRGEFETLFTVGRILRTADGRVVAASDRFVSLSVRRAAVVAFRTHTFLADSAAGGGGAAR